MPLMVVPLLPDGALVNVMVGLSGPDVRTLRQAGKPIPGPIAARAILDTGANATCLDPGVLTSLVQAVGLKPVRFLLANVPALGGVGWSAEYALSLPVVHPSGQPRDNRTWQEHPVVEQPLAQLGYQVLLGRDLLDDCLFVYNGPDGSFTLAY
jgi:hypothetical protein